MRLSNFSSDGDEYKSHLLTLVRKGYFDILTDVRLRRRGALEELTSALCVRVQTHRWWSRFTCPFLMWLRTRLDPLLWAIGIYLIHSRRKISYSLLGLARMCATVTVMFHIRTSNTLAWTQDFITYSIRTETTPSTDLCGLLRASESSGHSHPLTNFWLAHSSIWPSSRATRGRSSRGSVYTPR